MWIKNRFPALGRSPSLSGDKFTSGKEMLQSQFTQGGCRGILFSFWVLMAKGQSSLSFITQTSTSLQDKAIPVSSWVSEMARAPSYSQPNGSRQLSAWSCEKNGARHRHNQAFSFFFLSVLHVVFQSSHLILFHAYGLFVSLKIELIFGSTALYLRRKKKFFLWINGEGKIGRNFTLHPPTYGN